jgi:hypothetical protein
MEGKRRNVIGGLTAAGVAFLLPRTPAIVCMSLRGAEAFQVFNEMLRLSAVGIIAWLWTTVFVAAAIVTLFRLDDPDQLHWWERIIEGANSITSIILAWDAAAHDFSKVLELPRQWRFVVLLVIFIIVQGAVSFAARRARSIALRIRPSVTREVPSQNAEGPHNMDQPLAKSSELTTV